MHKEDEKFPARCLLGQNTTVALVLIFSDIKCKNIILVLEDLNQIWEDGDLF